MIPKIIHYCWFGGNPLPELAQKCIETWKKYCPDYTIMRWDESNFDVNCCSYVKEAYDSKKWAFITDYVRLAAIVEYGGIYMDTDVEVCKSLDEFLHEEAFSGFENEKFVPTGIMAGEKGQKLFAKLLEYYSDRHFIMPDGSYDMTTNTKTITDIVTGAGLILNGKKQTVYGMTFYPQDYFCPKDFMTGIIHPTANTACIHHFNQSWASDEDRKYVEVVRYCNNKFGKFGTIIYKLYRYVLHPHNIWLAIKHRITRNP